MSSHHFVKEGQEPALIIEDISQAEHVQAVLEWAPQVVVLESALTQIRLLGIKADVVFATPESLENVADDLRYQMPVDLLPATREKMLGDAFELLIRNGQRHVFVSVKQLKNHFELAQPYLTSLKITFLDEHTKWSSVSSGKVEKWWPEGSTLTIEASSGFRLEGHAKKTSEKTVLLTSGSLLGIASDGIFWLGEPLH
jgi:hypothetical protein